MKAEGTTGIRQYFPHGERGLQLQAEATLDRGSSPPSNASQGLRPSKVVQIFIPINLYTLQQWEIHQGPLQEDGVLLETAAMRSSWLVAMKPQVLVGLWAGH